MVCYAAGLFINGNIGDRVDPRIFFSINLFALAILYFLMFFLGTHHYTNPIIYYILFALDGFFQSIVLSPTI